jgi:hypothetical protein
MEESSIHFRLPGLQLANCRFFAVPIHIDLE